jgi:hypothetical protein
MTDEPILHNDEIPDPPDPTKADDVADAVFIGEQHTGDTVAVGREDKEEWILVEDMAPLDVAPE